MMDTGILGGGLTGVTLGRLLGRGSEVLEKNDETGGLCRSLQDDGFTFDYGGSHILFSKDEEVMGFIREALGNNIVRNRRNTKILFGGRYVKYPFENGLSDLSARDNLECLGSYIDNIVRGERRTPPRNFREWIIYTFGEAIAEKYMIPYNEKIWNTKPELMGMEWVRDRVPQPPMEDIIKSSLGIETEGYTHQLHFYYPMEGGMQSLVRSIGNASESSMVTGFDVKSVRREGDKWIVSDGSRENAYDRVVSTIHLWDLMRAMRDVPGDVRDAVNDLKCNSLVTVMLGLDVPKPNDLSWLYVPDRDVDTHRVSFPSNFSSRVAPDDKSSVLAEITCDYGDGMWNRKDDDIADGVVSDLHRLGVIDRDSVCYSRVMRSRYAYVVHDLDYLRNMEIIERYFARSGIGLCGRFSQFRYLNMDACIRSAMDTAARLGKAF